jgi:hypothetical protein
MGIERNSIDITGISPESELPSDIGGENIKYSEVENIYMPEHKPKIRKIMQISLNVEILSKRLIKSVAEKILVYDGLKHLKIIYMDKDETSKANIVNIDIPFNTFVELPKDSDGEVDTKIFIVDAFFHILDGRRIYSNIIYLINVVPK